MASRGDILIVGGYGEVGRRIAVSLEEAHPGRVVVAGRNPQRALGVRALRIDVDNVASIEAALEGVELVVACVRQREPHLLHAAIRRGMGYTSIAPPRTEADAIGPLHEEAQRSGARIVLGAGIEPGIASVLARMGADRVGAVDAVESALLLGIGDAYGADSMAFILDEIAETYDVRINGATIALHAFERPVEVTFPAPIGPRRGFTMPFSDQRYYPTTLGAKTAIARIVLDPAWIGSALARLTRMGLRDLMERRGSGGWMHGAIEKLRARYSKYDRFALLVEVRGSGRTVRFTLVGSGQAHATALGAAAIAEALDSGEVGAGVWLPEQVIAPEPFLARIAVGGLVPVVEEVLVPTPSLVSPMRSP